jgi:hypothetical protein
MNRATGLSLVVCGIIAGLIAFYCLYRLWKNGPYNTNLTFSFVFPFANWASVLLIGAGVGLYMWDILWLVVSLVVTFVIEGGIFSLYVFKQRILHVAVEGTQNVSVGVLRTSQTRKNLFEHPEK